MSPPPPPPGSRIPDAWIPIVIGAATCLVATGLAVALYQTSLLDTKRGMGRKPNGGKPGQRRRHLDIDIDLSDPLSIGSPMDGHDGVGSNGKLIVAMDPHQVSRSAHRSSADVDRDSDDHTFSAGNGEKQGIGGVGSDRGGGVPGVGPGGVGGSLGGMGDGSSVHSLPFLMNNVHHGLDPNLVRSIVGRLLDVAPVEPPESAFSGAVAGLSGRPALGGRRPGLAIREDTQLPPFYKQIDYLIREIKSAKRRFKPLLVEGAPGLGKASALQQWVSEEGRVRPAIYLQLSVVLRKRHGGSSLEDEEEVQDDFYTETETETEGLEERVTLTVRRDAFKRAVETTLGADSLEAEQDDDEDDDGTAIVDMTLFDHIAQALRLIASKSKHGPVLLVIDDVQLLFRERSPLAEKYDAIPEIFNWLLAAEKEGILDAVLCCSEKSAVGAIKRLRGFDWGLTLHAVDGVEDDVIIEYLLKEVNPRIQDPNRRFTQDTAAHFVATFNGSLLELDNYFRDVNSNVFMFIKKRERSFLRHLQRHIPQRPQRSPLSSRKQSTRTASEDELRELFLDIIMRGGVLFVSLLDVGRMSLAEALVERNILRWRDQRIRKREQRPAMKAGWTPPRPPAFNSWYEYQGPGGPPGEGGAGSPQGSNGATGSEGEGAEGAVNAAGAAVAAGAGAVAAGVGNALAGAVAGLNAAVHPGSNHGSLAVPGGGSGNSANGSNTTSRVFGLSRPDTWLGGMWSGSGSGNAGSKPAPAHPPAPEKPAQQRSVQFEEGTWTPPAPAVVDPWAGVVVDREEVTSVADLDAAEQLALFAREGAELVWSCNLVRTVCEAFVNGTQLQW
ncbi:hypothetical protein HK101_004860 [Irineochytrium annulatum]|nr:hypothetical protein HK101_004860 [Irineochytrium annulatum]